MTVHLVGAGPGDPGLLTVRALELLRVADVVIYDRLSQESLLDLAPAAERIDVGKAPGHVRMTQSEINDLLIERGRRGEAVVRLKGGDPFVFARGGEEAAALAEAGVPFEVVPGITSAIAVPAYAGIPVTLRHSSTSVTIVTGHEEPGVEGAEGTVDWAAVARVGGTIVVLMGVARIGRIAAELMAAGRAPDTPVAVVQWGTRPEQRTVRATLSTIADQPLGTPSTIVIGQVAASDLTWFENRPLFGRRVVVTRAREQARELVHRLQAQGAATVEVPAIEIRDPADGGAALAAVVDRLGDYDWVVLTSANGARRLLDAMRDGGRDARAFARARLAAIGPGTAEALAGANLEVDLVPPRFVAESLLDELPAPSATGGRLLLVRAAVARDVLPEGLRGKGWDVDVVEAYRTEQAALAEEQAAAVAAADIVTFTSSSTVINFLGAMGGRPIPAVVAAIGPITAATAAEHGLAVDVEAEVHTIDGLVDALVAWAAKAPRRGTGDDPGG
jgi:uroporphyrinogen III methyltransferase / synthase